MFRRTKRASTAGSITCVVSPAFAGVFPDALAPRRPALLGRLPEPLLHVRDRLALADAVDQGRLRERAPRELVAPDFIPRRARKDHRREEREPVHPQRAFGEEGAANLDGRDRPRLRGPRRKGGGAAAPSIVEGSLSPLGLLGAPRVHRGVEGPRYSPPIRYSYSASTFSSAGMTPSIRWPSSAICPRARANRSRSRVITSMPILSSFSRISVM